MTNCPYCAEEIGRDEAVCPHCRSPLGDKSVGKQGPSNLAEREEGPSIKKVAQTVTAASPSGRRRKGIVVVLSVLAALGLIVPLLLFSIFPSCGYRVVPTRGGICEFSNYCYGESKGFPSVPFNCEETASYLLSDTDNEKAVYPAETANQWMDCALACVGTCAKVDECALKCPAATLDQAYKWSCERYGTEIEKTDGMKQILYGDGLSTMKGGLELFAEIVRCERRQAENDFRKGRFQAPLEDIKTIFQTLGSDLVQDESQIVLSTSAAESRLNKRAENISGIFDRIGLRHSDFYRSVLEGYTDPEVAPCNYSGERVRSAILELSRDQQDLFWGELIWSAQTMGGTKTEEVFNRSRDLAIPSP